MIVIPAADRGMIKLLAGMVAAKLRDSSPDIVQCPHLAAAKILANDMSNGVSYSVENISDFATAVEQVLKDTK